MQLPKETKDGIIKLLEDAMLNEASISEVEKLGILIGRSYRTVADKLHGAFYNFAFPYGKEKEQQLYEQRKALLEYLELMSVTLDSFLAAHPVPEAPPMEQRRSPFDRC